MCSPYDGNNPWPDGLDLPHIWQVAHGVAEFDCGVLDGDDLEENGV
jgi:hypothetical protein